MPPSPLPGRASTITALEVLDNNQWKVTAAKEITYRNTSQELAHPFPNASTPGQH